MIASFSRTTLSRTLWFSNATKRCRPGYNKLCLDNFEKFQIGMKLQRDLKGVKSEVDHNISWDFLTQRLTFLLNSSLFSRHSFYKHTKTLMTKTCSSFANESDEGWNTHSSFNVCWRLIVGTREHRYNTQHNTFNLKQIS